MSPKKFLWLETPVVGRVCLFCTSLNLDLGDPGYSEYTPGSPAHVECMKDRWTLGEGDGREAFRVAMLTAERCPDFVEDRKS